MNIVLIGYMGSGKSTVGKGLSIATEKEFIDLDFFIETKENLSIQEIFKKHGEIKFRKIESAALKHLLEENRDIILSVGGGTPIFYDNMAIINKNSTSIYLQASPPTLSERLIKDEQHRPLIQHLNRDTLPEFVAKHLFERSHFYQEAKLKVNANQPIEKVIEDIIKSLP